MLNWQSIKMLIPALLVMGCTSTPIVATPPAYHPPLPTPYMSCEHVDWDYHVTKDLEVQPYLSYQHGLDLSECRDDLIRYLKEIMPVVEHYRDDSKNNS